MGSDAENIISKGKAELAVIVRRLVKTGMNREALLGFVRTAMDEGNEDE